MREFLRMMSMTVMRTMAIETTRLRMMLMMSTKSARF